MSKAEFDKFADHYDGGMDNAAKRWAGTSVKDFLLPKADLLLRRYDEAGVNASTRPRYLDFGCGTGDFLALIHEKKPEWEIEGCDVSSEMIAEGMRRWPVVREKKCLWLSNQKEFPRQAYDLITAVCVFLHIPPAEWVSWVGRLREALRPGGKLFLIEHNPWNPVTNWIVAHTKIDENANLLSIPGAKKVFSAAQLKIRRVDNFLFFPPRWNFTGGLERWCSAIPLGGQYMVEGVRPNE
jgi:SAM-dependent methyltransferase